VEATADEVVHPARGHRIERRRDHRERVLVTAQVHAQEELERRGLRELGRAAPASPVAVELAREGTRRLAEHRLGEGIVRGRKLGRAPHRLDYG
jgi:hypothetical protein